MKFTLCRYTNPWQPSVKITCWDDTGYCTTTLVGRATPAPQPATSAACGPTAPTASGSGRSTPSTNHGSANSRSGSTPTSTSTSTYRYQQDFKASENDARTRGTRVVVAERLRGVMVAPKN